MSVQSPEPLQRSAGEPPNRRVPLFGVEMDAMQMTEVVARIQCWTHGPADRCRYVVTPNVDHTVLLRDNPALQQAYQAADLVLADGWPVVLASRLLGRSLPQRIAGSDLVPELLAAGGWQLRVFLLGAAPGVARRAADNIRRDYGVTVVGTCSPPRGFEHDADQNRHILREIAQHQPDLVILGLGAPKQELWVDRHRHEIAAKVVLCVGATIDFLAGERRRAPRWIRRIGLEWIYRMLGEPKRLAGRYARDAVIFPQLVWQEWRKGSQSTKPTV